MKSHGKKHEIGGELNQETNRAPCNICGVLILLSSLESHISQVHSTEVHKCDVCDFTANTKLKVDGHRKKHFKEMSKCPECGKSVKQLKNHFRKNCSGKTENHNCHLCEKTFKHKQSLKIHIKCVHDKIKNIQCQLCQYTTYKNFNLKYVFLFIFTFNLNFFCS